MQKLRNLITSQELLDALAGDGLPIAEYNVDHIVERIKTVVAEKGSYTVEASYKVGALFTFYDAANELLDVLVLGTGNDPTTTVPRTEWLRKLIAPMRIGNKTYEADLVQKLIASHIEGGGTWVSLINDRQVRIQLLLNGSVVMELTFRPETLSPFKRVDPEVSDDQ